MTGDECGYAIPVAPDDVFTAISNERRRQVLLSLAQSNDPLTVSDLSVEIAAMEELTDPSKVTSEQRTRVYISLVQTHLETLNEVGAIDYDERGKQVQATDATEPIASHVRRITTACYMPKGDEE